MMRSSQKLLGCVLEQGRDIVGTEIRYNRLLQYQVNCHRLTLAVVQS